MIRELLIFIVCLVVGVGVSQAEDPNDPNAVAEPVRQQDETGLLVIEAENLDDQAVHDEANWFAVSDTTASRGQAMQTTLIDLNISGMTEAVASGPRLDFECEFVKSGTHYIWARCQVGSNGGNSIHFGIDFEANDSADRMQWPGSAVGWVWTQEQRGSDVPASLDISAGVHTVNLYMREAGSLVDKLVITTDPNYVPSGYGPRDPLLGPAITLEPTEDVVATGDNGMVLSIAGVDTSGLILGTTTLSGDPKHDDFPPEAADNFDLSVGASGDDQEWVQTVFDLPVTTIFIIEKGGNDSGYIVGLDKNGDTIDDPTPFSPADFANTGLKGVQNQKVAATIVTPETPIYGIRILPPDGEALGFDPTSVSGIPGVAIGVKAIDSLDAVTAADLDPDDGDPSTLIEVLAIDGYGVEELILGTTTVDYEKFADHPAVNADNFELTNSYASLDEASYVQTVFAEPVAAIFILERGANDQGLIQPIDADGNDIGEPLAFGAADMQFQELEAGDKGVKVSGQTAGGMVISGLLPINGIVILPKPGGAIGIDPACIAGVPLPKAAVAPIDSLVVDDPNDDDPETPIVATAINGIGIEDLILGVTTANPDNQQRVDNYNVDSDSDYARREPGTNFVTTMFDVPVVQVFVLEKDGNDSGYVLPLDADGLAIGGRVAFTADDFLKTETSQWTVGGMVITPEVPIQGIRIWSTGIDVQSVSAVPE